MTHGTGDWLPWERLRRLLGVLTPGPRRAIATVVVALATMSLTVAGIGGGGPAGMAAAASAPISDWTATEAPLPTNANGDPFVTLGSVVCTPDGSCVATGNYTDTSGSQQGLIETLVSGAWTATEAPLPTA